MSAMCFAGRRMNATALARPKPSCLRRLSLNQRTDIMNAIPLPSQPAAGMKFRQLAIPCSDDLLFGHAPKPIVTRHGLKIGGGLVYPELNFTLPPMEVTAATMPIVARHYRDIIADALRRAVELEAPGVIIEFETLPPMTATPAFGLEIVNILLAGMDEARRTHGLRSALRMTPNDNREFARPPVMRSGEHWERMLELFEGSAKAGAELLSIESVGGKELHDEALMN